MAKILLVDDDSDFLEVIRIMLESQTSHEVRCAGDGEEGWERIREERPDLIVLDVMMPKKDGYTLCSELKDDDQYSDIPIILLTGVGSQTTSTRYTPQMGRMTQANDYVKKPIKPEELLPRIEHLLEVHS